MKKYALACAAALALLGAAGPRASACCFSFSWSGCCGCSFSVGCGCTWGSDSCCGACCGGGCGGCCDCCSCGCWGPPYYPVDLSTPCFCGAGYSDGYSGDGYPGYADYGDAYGGPSYPAYGDGGYAAPAAPATGSQPAPSSSFPPAPKPVEGSKGTSYLPPASSGYQPVAYPSYGYPSSNSFSDPYPGYGYGSSQAGSYGYGR
jgi:hypothetical protein